MTDIDIKPRLIAFEVTRKCRMNCKHCRANAGYDKASELDTTQCKKIIDSLSAYQKCVLIFTGGEPMERDDIYELISYSRDAGMRNVLATCGYPINETSIEKLKQAGVMALSFSIDAATAKKHDEFRQVTGAFDWAVEAAKVAKKAGMRFQINTTISRGNIEDVEKVAKLAYELGAYCFNPFILVPTGRAENLADEILDSEQYENLLHKFLEIKRNLPIEMRVTCGPQFARLCRQEDTNLNAGTGGCMGGRGFGFISYRGDIQTCGFLDISAGNLVENGYDFEKIWTQSKFLNEIRAVDDYQGKCGICEYVSSCGGCRARAFTMTGSYVASDPICDYRPNLQLEKLDKQICDRLQRGLNIVRRPFADIAGEFGIGEDKILSRVDYLLKKGVIRRLAAMINYRSLGRASTLVAAAVEADRIEEVAGVISGLENVSHNYQRKNYYNLWFTLQGRDEADIDGQLKKLSAELKVDFKSLPVERFFKLDVNFDIADDAEVAEVEENELAGQVVELTGLQKKILIEIQQGIKPVSNAFDFLCDEQVDIEKALEILGQLKNIGVIKRIGAVLNHRLLGYSANVMLVCRVDENVIDHAGRKLARYRQVSHCYQRKAFSGFDYNLFGMIHAKGMGEINSLVAEFVREEHITDYQLLTTVREFKKKAVRYQF